MINSRDEIRDFCRMVESYGRQGLRRQIREAYSDLATMWRTGDINRGNFSIRKTFEESVPGGQNWVREFRDSHRNGGSGVFYEAGAAVNTAHFANIIGQITFGEVMRASESPDFIAMSLVTKRSASTAEQEIVPGVTMLGDVAGDVGEGENYPEAGVSEDFTVMPKKIKEGFIVSVTEEVVFEDKTGLVLERAKSGMDSISLSQEKDGLNMVLGVTTSWKRKNGAAVATYGDLVAGTHPFDNLSASTSLANHDSIATMENLLYAMLDLNTGEKKTFPSELDIVIPHQLRYIAHWILASGNVERLTASDTLRAIAANPIGATGRKYNVKSNSIVTDITSSATTWFAGDFKGAFEYAEIWPTQLFVEDRNSATGFSRDVIMRSKVRRKGAFGVRDPQRVIKCTA
jgi:hypothetical protein